MRVSEFWRAVGLEFGEVYGRSLTRDVVLSEFDRSAVDAIESGADARAVWLALCAAMDVPVERRHGVGQLRPRE